MMIGELVKLHKLCTTSIESPACATHCHTFSRNKRIWHSLASCLRAIDVALLCFDLRLRLSDHCLLRPMWSICNFWKLSTHISCVF